MARPAKPEPLRELQKLATRGGRSSSSADRTPWEDSLFLVIRQNYMRTAAHVSRTNKHFRLTTIALTRKEEEAFQDGDEGEM